MDIENFLNNCTYQALESLKSKCDKLLLEKLKKEYPIGSKVKEYSNYIYIVVGYKKSLLSDNYGLLCSLENYADSKIISPYHCTKV